MKILIPTQLQKITKSAELECDAPRIHSLISSLCLSFPELTSRILDKDMNLNKFINFYVNDEDIRFLDGENTKLNKDDVISIIAATAGG